MFLNLIKDDGKMKIYVFTALILYGCSIVIESHPLTDKSNKVHYYVKKVSKKDNNLPKKYFCQSHYRWESVSLYYGENGVKYTVK